MLKQSAHQKILGNEKHLYQPHLQSGVIDINVQESVEEDNTELIEMLKDQFRSYIKEELGRLTEKMQIELENNNKYQQSEQQKLKLRLDEDMGHLNRYQEALQREIEVRDVIDIENEHEVSLMTPHGGDAARAFAESERVSAARLGGRGTEDAGDLVHDQCHTPVPRRHDDPLRRAGRGRGWKAKAPAQVDDGHHLPAMVGHTYHGRMFLR